MARIRSIKPDFASDSKVARLSLQARLTFLLLLPEADDEGRMTASPKRIAGLLYPNDDNIGPKQVERWIGELAAEHMVLIYEVDGSRYLLVVNFRKHQHPQHPTTSTLPPPPHPNGSSHPHEPVMRDSRPPPESLTPELREVDLREVDSPPTPPLGGGDSLRSEPQVNDQRRPRRPRGAKPPDPKPASHVPFVAEDNPEASTPTESAERLRALRVAT